VSTIGNDTGVVNTGPQKRIVRGFRSSHCAANFPEKDLSRNKKSLGIVIPGFEKNLTVLKIIIEGKELGVCLTQA
jgi:hypothetical protein